MKGECVMNVAILALIVIYIVDLSGITDSIKGWVSSFAGRKVERFKPFDCSLCMVWWCGLAYLIITGGISLLSVAYVALLSFLAESLGKGLKLIKYGIDKVLDWIYIKLD